MKKILLVLFISILNINPTFGEQNLLQRVKNNPNEEIALMINSLGATPLEELYIISRRLNKNLVDKKINIFKTYVGRYATSMEMAGMSITFLKLNDTIKKYLIAPTNCPFWNN